MKFNIKFFLTIMVIFLTFIYFLTFNKYEYINDLSLEIKKIYTYNVIGTSEKFNKNKIDIYYYFFNKVIKEDYNVNFINVINDEYFKFSFFDRYYSFYIKNRNLDSRDIVESVNCNIDKDYYSDFNYIKDNNNLNVLVNKFNRLDDDFIPNDLVLIEKQYGYSYKMNSEAYEYFKKMALDMKKQNLNIFVVSAFRSFNYQKKIYNNYVKLDGVNEADRYSARPGFSEHQTGLAIDIASNSSHYTLFEKSKEYKWMLDNSYKYGFILRYPKNKEKQTGYKFESWHYRFLGVSLARKVYDSGLTYDEYYEFFIKK